MQKIRFIPPTYREFLDRATVKRIRSMEAVFGHGVTARSRAKLTAAPSRRDRRRRRPRWGTLDGWCAGLARDPTSARGSSRAYRQLAFILNPGPDHPGFFLCRGPGYGDADRRFVPKPSLTWRGGGAPTSVRFVEGRLVSAGLNGG